MRLHLTMCLALALGALPLYAADAPVAARPAFSQPAISPDGRNIAFVADGGIWTVPVQGGDARLLVSDNLGANTRPLYSPDGRHLAFRTDAAGEGSGIYVLDLASNVVQRVTYADSADAPDAWSRDGQWLYLSSPRDNVGGLHGVYRVRASGGTPMPVSLETYRNEEMAAPSPDGKQLALVGGGMGDWQWWRHGHSHLDEGAIWLLSDDGSHQYRRLSADNARAEWPMWAPAGNTLYYMSDRSGTENIWRIDLAGSGESQLSHFTDGRVLWPSLSTDGRVMAFERDFGIWTLDPATGQAHAVPIQLQGVIRSPAARHLNMHEGFSQIALSPDGKKLALVARGEVYVTDADKGGLAQRISHSVAEEYQPVWAPDSRRLVYGSNREGHGQLFLYDFTSGKETALSKDDGDDTQPHFSPDGKQLAFVRNQHELCVLELATGKVRVLARAPIDLPRPIGTTQPIAWSPDGHWIAYLAWGQRMFRNAHAVNLADGHDVTLSYLGNTDADNVLWDPDRRSLFFTTGQRTESGRIARVDLIARAPQFHEDDLQQLFKPADKNKDSKDSKDSKDKPTAAADGDKDEQSKPKPPVNIDANAIRERLSLLPVGLDVQAAQISPDGKTLLLTAKVAGKSNLYSWSLDPLAKEPPVARQLTSTPGNKSDAQFGADGKKVFYLDAGKINTVELKDNAKPTALDVTASQDVDFASEKTIIFDQAWTWLRDDFHDQTMHGVDWNRVRAIYAPLVAGAQTPGALYRLLNLMVGELNASHSGARAPGSHPPITGQLGLSFDRTAYEQHGQFRIDTVLALSPADVAGGIKPGEYLLAIDGNVLDGTSNLAQQLANRIGDKVMLTIADDPKGRNKHEVAVKPINAAALSKLIYQAWVVANRAYVAKISGGRLGYVHLQDMSEESLESFYKDLDAQNATRDGVVIDERNNFGGFVNAYALDVLSRQPYLSMTYRGFDREAAARGILGQRALERPTVLITNRVTLSDGEDFSEGYRAMHLGQVVGEPTAGWIIFTSGGELIDGGSVRLPFATVTDAHGQPMEGHPRPVDVPVSRPLGEAYTGHDSDLDAAVRVLSAHAVPATARR